MKVKNNNIYLSIIVPVFNTEKYLSKCLDSIINAKLENTEIIIINDGSTDNSEKIIKKYQIKYDDIKYIKKINGGLASVKNLGIKEAKGKYISFIDSDDSINEKFYKEAKKYLDDGYDIITYDFNNITKENKKSITEAKSSIYNGIEENKGVFYTSIMPSSCNKIVRRSLFIDNELYFPEGILYEDLATTPLLFINANKIKYLNKPYYNYSIFNNSIMRNENYIKKFINMTKSLNILNKRLSKYNNFDEKEFLIFNCLWRIEDFLLDNLYCINRLYRFFLTIYMKIKLGKMIKKIYSYKEVNEVFSEINKDNLKDYYFKRNKLLVEKKYIRFYIFMLKHKLYENRPNFCYEFNEKITKKLFNSDLKTE